MSKFYEKLKEAIIDHGDGDLEFNQYELFIQNMPNAIDENGEDEALDFENFNVVYIDGEKMTFTTGGDWQENVPLITSGIDSNGVLEVKDYTYGVNWSKIKYLDIDEVIDSILI